MHPDIAVSLVNALGLILSAAAAAFATRANHNAKKGRESSERGETHAAAAHEGVTNSHTTHMRDDIDGIGEKLDKLTEDVNAALEALWIALKGKPPTAPIKLPEGHQ